MGRRRNPDWFDLIPPLAGMVILLCFVSPKARQSLFALSFFTITFAGTALMVVIGYAIYRKRSAASSPSSSESSPTALNVSTPQISANRTSLSNSASDLVEQLRGIDWFQFEKLIALLYRKTGYVVSRRGGANPDGGIDLIVEKDGQRSAIQCKQWKTWNVGVRAVREFLGALTDAGIQQGIFITLCGYTGEAKRLASKHGIQIVSESDLVKMLEMTEAKYDPELLAILQDSRKFCPKCESQMLVRTAGKGLNPGGQFWGCSRYPACRFTMPLQSPTAN